MKVIVLTYLFLTGAGYASAQKVYKVISKCDEIRAEDIPPALIDCRNYPEGTTAFMKFVQDNMMLPEKFRQNKHLKYVVWIDITVDTFGNPVGYGVDPSFGRDDMPKMEKCSACDSEAIRVLKLVKKWKKPSGPFTKFQLLPHGIYKFPIFVKIPFPPDWDVIAKQMPNGIEYYDKYPESQ